MILVDSRIICGWPGVKAQSTFEFVGVARCSAGELSLEFIADWRCPEEVIWGHSAMQ